MYCSKCGKEVKNGDKFCSKCGQQVDKNLKKNKFEYCKKTALIGLLVALIAFVLMLLTDNKDLRTIWNICRIVVFIALVVYFIGIISCTVIARKNNQKLKGWLSWAQVITAIIIIVVIFVGIFTIISDNNAEESRERARQELMYE